MGNLQGLLDYMENIGLREGETWDGVAVRYGFTIRDAKKLWETYSSTKAISQKALDDELNKRKK